MKRKSIIAVLALVLVLALSLSIFSACNKKHKYSSEWKYDEKTHWHECTTKKHTDTSEKLPHEFKEDIVKEAGYGVAGEKKCTCKECGYSYTQEIPALNAKDRDIKFADSVVLDKVYDGMPVSLTKEQIIVEGGGEITISFVEVGEDKVPTEEAPKKAGKYKAIINVANTDEWVGIKAIKEFEITKKPLTEETVTQEYDGRSFIIAEPKGKVGSDDVQIVVTMSGKDVGATKESVALSGDDADNYSITLNDVTASITQKDITEYIPKNKSYSYNASTSLFLYNGSTGSFGTVNGDAVHIRVIFESKNVGTTKITGVSITGVASGNYVVDHTKLSGKISAVPLDLKGIHFKIFKFGEDNYYSVPLKLTQANVDNSFNNDDITIKMVKYNGTHAIGDTWTLTDADADCFEITGADRGNYSIVRFSDDEDFACTATLAVDESMPELTNEVYNKELKPGTYWYKKDVEAGNKTLVYAQSKMKITVYKPDGNNATFIDNEIIVSQKTTLYFYVVVTENANRGPRVDNSTTTFAEMTIGTPYSLPQDKKYLLKVSLPQNGYYQITRARFSPNSYSFYDEQGNKLTPHTYDGRAVIRKPDGHIDYYSDHISTIANFGDSVKVVYISISGSDTSFNNYITVSKTKDFVVSETGKYLEGEAKYFSGQLNAGKITINEGNSTVLSERKLTYKVYDADLKEITMNADGTFDIPAKGKYLIEVSNLTTADIESVTFRIVTA